MTYPRNSSSDIGVDNLCRSSAPVRCRKSFSATRAIACWNVRGYYGDGNTAKRKTIDEVCSEISVLCLTELKGKNGVTSIEQRGHDTLICGEYVGVQFKSNQWGLVSYSFICGGRALSVVLMVGSIKYVFISVYAYTANDSDKNEVLFSQIQQYVSRTNMPKLFILGDFNSRTGTAALAGHFGRYIYGRENANTEHFRDLLVSADLEHVGSFFSRRWRQRATWFHPSSRKTVRQWLESSV
jgi:hypothetical protein